MSEPLHLSIVTEANVPRLVVRGSLMFGQDLTALTDAISDLASTTSPVILDMNAVDTIDSSALGALVESRQALPSPAVRIVLFGPSQQVLRALEMIHLTHLFETAASEAELALLLE